MPRLVNSVGSKWPCRCLATFESELKSQVKVELPGKWLIAKPVISPPFEHSMQLFGLPGPM